MSIIARGGVGAVPPLYTGADEGHRGELFPKAAVNTVRTKGELMLGRHTQQIPMPCCYVP